MAFIQRIEWTFWDKNTSKVSKHYLTHLSNKIMFQPNNVLAADCYSEPLTLAG